MIWATLKSWWWAITGQNSPVMALPDPPKPECVHDDRVDPDGWQLDPNGNGYINVCDGRTVILCHDTATKRWRRLIVCAKCHRGRFEFKSEDLTANWAKVDEQ